MIFRAVKKGPAKDDRGGNKKINTTAKDIVGNPPETRATLSGARSVFDSFRQRTVGPRKKFLFFRPSATASVCAFFVDRFYRTVTAIIGKRIPGKTGTFTPGLTVRDYFFCQQPQESEPSLGDDEFSICIPAALKIIRTRFQLFFQSIE